MFEADWWMLKVNDEQEMISKDYTECILNISAHALESSDFLIQSEANQCAQHCRKKVQF